MSSWKLTINLIHPSIRQSEWEVTLPFDCSVSSPHIDTDTHFAWCRFRNHPNRWHTGCRSNCRLDDSLSFFICNLLLYCTPNVDWRRLGDWATGDTPLSMCSLTFTSLRLPTPLKISAYSFFRALTAEDSVCDVDRTVLMSCKALDVSDPSSDLACGSSMTKNVALHLLSVPCSSWATNLPLICKGLRPIPNTFLFGGHSVAFPCSVL